MGTKAEEHLQAYSEHSKVLRTWLVAYGIGAPVLVVTHDAATKALKASGHATLITVCFFIGVVLQVVLAALNKASMWGLYYGEENPSSKYNRWYKLAHGFSERFWIDLFVDAATLVVFGIATWKTLRTLIG